MVWGQRVAACHHPHHRQPQQALGQLTGRDTKSPVSLYTNQCLLEELPSLHARDGGIICGTACLPITVSIQSLKVFFFLIFMKVLIPPFQCFKWEPAAHLNSKVYTAALGDPGQSVCAS